MKQEIKCMRFIDFHRILYTAKISDTRYIVETNGNTLEVTFDNAQELLDKGYNPKYLFDYVDYFVYGYARIRLNDKYNWINRDYRLVSPEQWFDYADDFNENGYSIVLFSNTSYKIDTNGQLYDYDTMRPIDQPTTNNMALNELKYIIRESIKRQLNNL